MSFCRNCGCQLTYENDFCPRCRKPTNYTYSELVFAAIGGDSSATSALYKRTYKEKYYIAFKYMKNKDDAEDVLQDAYVRAFGHLSSLTDKEGFPYWLSTIVANTAKNALKKKKPELFQDTIYENDEGEETDPLLSVEDVKRTACPEENLLAKDRAQLIQELMSSLNEEQQICIMMYYLEEMKVKDIASALDINENTVKSRLFQARKALTQKGEDMKKKGYVFSVAPLPLLIRLFFSERFSFLRNAPVLPPVPREPFTSAGGYRPAPSPRVSAGQPAPSSHMPAGRPAPAPRVSPSQPPYIKPAPQTVANAIAGTAADTVGKSAATAVGVKTGTGILASLGGKIAVGILSAVVLGGAVFGGIKAAPYILDVSNDSSKIVQEEDVSTEESSSINNENAEEESSPELSHPQTEQQEQEAQQEQLEEQNSESSSSNQDKSTEITIAQAQAILPVYQAYKEILGDYKDSLGQKIITDPYPVEATYSDLSDEGSIAFYDVWGDGIKEMIFCSCEVDYGWLRPSFYCVTSSDGQIYYLTDNGLSSLETGAALTNNNAALQHKFCVFSIYAPSKGKGLYLDLNMDKYLAMPTGDISDPRTAMQIERIHTDFTYAYDPTTVYYSHGYGFSGDLEKITQEQYDEYMEDFTSHRGTLLLTTTNAEESIGMNYEEAIAFLDGEISQLNAILNRAAVPSQNSQKETSEEAGSNSSESEASTSKREGYTTQDLPYPWGDDIVHKILDVVIDGETLLESAEKGKGLDWLTTYYYKAMKNREQGTNFGVWLMDVGYHEAKAAGWGLAWLQACSQSQETKAYVSEVTASSELDESDIGIDHSADMICDGSLMNAWCEGVSGYGIDEWVQLKLGQGFAIDSMEFNMGYQKSSELYYANGRPAEILIVFDEGDGNTTSETVILEDMLGAQTITFDTIHYAETVTIYIKSVYEGTTYEDTVISEVSFN